MCIRCRLCEAPREPGYCAACVVQTRFEVTEGFLALERYLDAWALFDDWLPGRPER
jgi:hypothetical protein